MSETALATLFQMLERCPDGDRPAIEGLDAGPMTHGTLRTAVMAIGGWLQESGALPGSRIALLSRNRPEMATAFLGAACAASAAPLNPSYGRTELDFYLDDLAPRLILVEEELDTPAREAARARGIEIIEIASDPSGPAGSLLLNGQRATLPLRVHPEAHDVALILHTSGTTSRPKMVPLTHANLTASARHIAATLRLGAEDRSLTVMPLFHIHGLVAGLLAPLGANGTVIVPPGFQASEFAGWLERFQPTWYTAVPTMHQAILRRLETEEGRRRRAAAPLRFVRSSSAAMPPRTLDEIETVLGVPVIEAYGMTEAAHQMTSNPLPPGVRHPGSVGPAAGPEIAIMDDNGMLLPRGSVGEVVIRGPNVTAGYLGNDDANREAFQSGWFRTGDQGMVDESGVLTLTGRLKELINRAGEKVAPLEVDAVLTSHPAVAQAISFGIPHPLLGEEVAAAVVLRADEELSARALRSFAATRLAYYKVPREIRFVEQIPVGPTGKLQRRGLAEQLGVVATVPVISGDTTAPRSPVEEIVAMTWQEVLGTAAPGVHENFFALGGDSMLAIRAVARLRDLLQVDLPLMWFFDAPTIAAIGSEIEQLLAMENHDA